MHLTLTLSLAALGLLLIVIFILILFIRDIKRQRRKMYELENQIIEAGEDFNKGMYIFYQRGVIEAMTELLKLYRANCKNTLSDAVNDFIQVSHTFEDVKRHGYISYDIDLHVFKFNPNK